MFEQAPPSAGEVRALAHQLLAWADHLVISPEPGHELSEEGRHDLILGLALAIRATRRLRTEIFPGAPLGNATWDIMLDLFIQDMNGYRTSLDHLAIAGDLPAAAVYEAVELAAGLGLLERTPDRFDSRVVWLSLSVSGRQGMFDLFEKSADLVRPLPRADSAERDARQPVAES
jgi:hypothetical protein